MINLSSANCCPVAANLILNLLYIAIEPVKRNRNNQGIVAVVNVSTEILIRPITQCLLGGYG